MTTDRVEGTATLLQDGRVLFAEGYSLKGVYYSSAEIFDPNTNQFTRTGSMATARVWGGTALLRDGKVLVVGGINDVDELASAELFDPVTGEFSATGSMNHPRANCTATLLLDGTVLIAGGGLSSSGEIYWP
jgi:hypothetical protein